MSNILTVTGLLLIAVYGMYNYSTLKSVGEEQTEKYKMAMSKLSWLFYVGLVLVLTPIAIKNVFYEIFCLVTVFVLAVISLFVQQRILDRSDFDSVFKNRMFDSNILAIFGFGLYFSGRLVGRYFDAY